MPATVYLQIPPRVEYELMLLGVTLIEPARSIVHRAFDNYGSIEPARGSFDAAAGG